MNRKDRKTYEALLGAFAWDIRQGWGECVGDRIAEMKEIMEILGVDYEIDEEACFEDGRWMRDEWEGPYDPLVSTKGLNRDIIEHYASELLYNEFELSNSSESSNELELSPTRSKARTTPKVRARRKAPKVWTLLLNNLFFRKE